MALRGAQQGGNHGDAPPWKGGYSPAWGFNPRLTDGAAACFSGRALKPQTDSAASRPSRLGLKPQAVQ
jgi:hypothetical protein